MSLSNTSFAAAVSEVKQSMIIFVQVWSFCLFTFGVIGHALSIYVFTRPRFHFNPCTRYFLASTLSGYAVVFLNVPLRLLQLGYNIDVFIYSIHTCQILSFVLAYIKVLPPWFIALASFDRFLCSSSSATLRGWSSIRVASRAIPLTVLFIGLAYIHLPFHYTIFLPQRSCTYISSTYQAFFALWNLFFWSWIPTACMLIFGLLIIRNVRQGRMRVAPQNRLQQNHKKTDRQLIQMLFMQSFLLSSMTTLLSIGSLYISITNNLRVKNDLDKAKDSYMFNALSFAAIIEPCMSFYIFTLSSQLFRHELVDLFCWQRPTRVIINVNADNK